MAYELENRLVIGLASSALFDLSDSDKVFRDEGEQVYRDYQRKNQNEALGQGVAFSFIKRLLFLNEISPENPPVEVVLLSRNDPDTGLRVMNSIKHHELDITRAVFLQGQNPYQYIPAFSISLFLSANANDVLRAIEAGYPAGQVLNVHTPENDDDKELRVAFDFDGVIADDEAEKVYQKSKKLDLFYEHEVAKVNIAHNPGILKELLEKLSNIQKREQEIQADDPSYKLKLRISIVTARSAPSHERVINTMREWGITVNEAFFLGGIEKRRVLQVLKPHIFFDDQKMHLESTAGIVPSVHIPFGVTNQKPVLSEG